MLGLSTADGFMSVKGGVDDMIKYLANEPSMGLYFVQQHAQSSMPYLLDVKDKVMEKIHEVTLQTEDVEDSIDVVQSMTEIGYPLVEEMIKDIKTSLLIISKCQPKRGLIQMPTWGRQTESRNSNVAVAVGCSDKFGHQDDEGSHSYLSAVLSSAKQRAVGFRRPPIYQSSKFDQPVQPSSQSPLESDASTQSYADAEELPVSVSLEIHERPLNPSGSHGSQDSSEVLYPSEDYSKFKYEKEAKFEAWLQESDGLDKFIRPAD
ncbi:uncharacterized protein LOC110094125 [Dendrobium catenatum]|uniref:Uncharacterized protein n=1 Tax=Dendrobium catenatum TaxID=906689 RepID=A0A2I0W1X9_9ASPA|nr:uncharacterized protein LOC110094125 [Dendrobium catenatum]PKU69669.1 hypothetical protein MA16_Dca026020 [Dendrobium catenatum]